MNENMNKTNIKIGLTSAVVLGCASITYLALKQKYKIKNATDAFEYLRIKIVTSEEHCDDVVSELRRRSSKHHAIGFDCEWVTDQGIRQPVALLQLSTNDGFCGLFRLSHIKFLPKSLKDLLEDETIYKVGVAPLDDARYLTQDYGVYLKGTLDIRHIVHYCGLESGGLASLSISLLNIALDKTWRIRCSNWSAKKLTERQIKYAAADAHVAIKIFVKLLNDYHKSGLLSWFWKTSDNNNWRVLDECRRYTDVSYKTKQDIKKSNKEPNHMKKESKDAKISKRYPHLTRCKPLYHNCFLQAPDGELLCTCENKKAIWYMEKDLADLVSEDPLTVRLRFEPAGRAVGDVGRYYQLTKENKCVVCGAKDSYIRKNVVPREYRKYFPEIMKDHSSHDVVLLCVPCHQRSNMLDQAIRERLAEQCDAPLVTHDGGKYTEDADCKKIRSASRALLYQSRKHVLPEARRKELENIILQHYLQHDEITEELLKEAADIQVRIENADYESHGYKVAEFYNDNEGLFRLEELWREHFLKAMNPKYMPELWSVKHNEERLTVHYLEGRLSDEDQKILGLQV